MAYKLRSHRWFRGGQETGVLHRGALESGGIDMDHYSGQPVIGIANTWSELNNCNMSLRTIAEEVKKGIRAAGGIPLEFPVISLGEELMKPTAMLYRNLLSMDVEENLRAYPIDGVILLGNCDKTVPGLLMGAVSANLPCIQLNGGPKKAGVFKGKRMGSGTDLWKYWEEYRMQKITEQEWEAVGKSLSCGFGSCNTMGTASTMNGLLEGLGVMPLGLSTLAVDDPRRYELSRQAGERIVAMVMEGLKPSDILTTAAFKNAVSLCMALGGSTNAILHLTAIAGRLLIPLYPDVFRQIGETIPCLVDVQPVGEALIDEFDAAGGIPAVLTRLLPLLDLSAMTCTGQTLGALLKEGPERPNRLIRPLSDPVKPAPTLGILYGNLAPGGAIIKVAAASPQLLVHCGPAVVFEDYEDMLSRIDDPMLAVDPGSILVLKAAGPKGVPGMPEWGMIPIPKKLQAAGVTDMVRISDARMSGTSFGTVVLHICPESSDGGPLGLVCNGDLISLNVPEGKLELMISDQELTARRANWKAHGSQHRRGYPVLYIREVLQADEGCDFRFLKPFSKEDLIFREPMVGRS